MKHIIVLDNGGQTYDRFTIINKENGDMFGASSDPFHPMGFGQYCGNVADDYWRVAYGMGWRRNCREILIKRRVKFAVDYLLADCAHIGRVVDFDTLPKDVQTYAVKMCEPEKQEA